MPYGESWPKVSVVVINVKGTGQLERCLGSLTQTDYPDYEVIVVDCLTLHLERWMKTHFPTVKIVHFDYDIGASASHNAWKEAADADSEYAAFLDNDTYVTANWLSELVRVMKTDETIGLAQAKILLASNPRLLDHRGLSIDALGTWHTTKGQREKEFLDIREIFVASSACCLVRRRLFNEAGGFDPTYFIYDDDTDFSFRIWLLGYKITFVPTSIVTHMGGTDRLLSPKKLNYSVKNRIYTMLKNYELGNMWWRVPTYCILTFLAALVLFSKGESAEGNEMLKGIWDPMRKLRKIWTERLQIQIRRRLKDSDLVRRGFLGNDLSATL